eukprot:Skav217926  [mRNA]  locus=scaffold2633:106605:110712:- [translate_table: standard]
MAGNSASPTAKPPPWPGESVWDHPCDEHYRKVYEKYKAQHFAEGLIFGGIAAKKEADKPSGNDDKKKEKDKARRNSMSASDPLGFSGDFDVPKMDLPKPGESLFGKPSKNKRLAGRWKTRKQHGNGSVAGGIRAHDETASISCVSQEKLLQLQADFEMRREEKTQQLRQELERHSWGLPGHR